MHNYIIFKEKLKIKDIKNSYIFGEIHDNTVFSRKGEVVVEYLQNIYYLLISQEAYLIFLKTFYSYSISDKFIVFIFSELYVNIKKDIHIRVS